MLAPLANLVAIRSHDLVLLERLRRDIETRKSHEVYRPSQNWVVAVSPLPPHSSRPKQNGRTYFVEGSDLFSGAGAADEIGATAARAPERLRSFTGDFGFLHIDDDGDAAVVRSCGGRVPFYVWGGRGLILVATTLSDVIRFMPGEPTIDGLTCATWMTGWSLWPYGRTFFKEVSAVPRGHAVHISEGTVSRDTIYWDPRPDGLRRPSPKMLREHAESLREILFASLDRELDPNGHNLLTLSGGVDSSSLAAIAAGPLGRAVDTLTLLVPGEEARSREMTYIDTLRTAVPLNRSWEFALDLRGRIELVRAAPRVAFPMFHPALGALPQVLEEQNVSVLFGGEFGDEIGGSSFTIPDWLRDTGFWRLLRSPRAWPSGKKRTPLLWAKHRARDAVRRPFWPFPETIRHTFIASAAREEYRQWMYEWRRAEASDRRPLRYLSLQAETDGFVAMNWEAASSLGVRRAWPFFSREALELGFECHPSELVGPGIKKLLRAALVGDVPPQNLHRADRGHSPNAPQMIELPELPDALSALFARPPTTEEQSKEGWPLLDPWVELWSAVEELGRNQPFFSGM
jgi:asparagine synthetase B (glutamine-hydrolysing)